MLVAVELVCAKAVAEKAVLADDVPTLSKYLVYLKDRKVAEEYAKGLEAQGGLHA